MSVITEILDRLAGVEVVKEKLRETGARVEQLAQRLVDADRQLQDVDRRLVRIETFAEIAKTRAGGRCKLPVYRGKGGLVGGVDPLSNKAMLQALDDEEGQTLAR